MWGCGDWGVGSRSNSPTCGLPTLSVSDQPLRAQGRSEHCTLPPRFYVVPRRICLAFKTSNLTSLNRCGLVSLIALDSLCDLGKHLPTSVLAFQDLFQRVMADAPKRGFGPVPDRCSFPKQAYWTNDTPSSDVKHCASLKEFSALIIASPVGLT
jgi:hypothetical protein